MPHVLKEPADNSRGVLILTHKEWKLLPPDAPGGPAFEVWRRRIQGHFPKGEGA